MNKFFEKMSYYSEKADEILKIIKEDGCTGLEMSAAKARRIGNLFLPKWQDRAGTFFKADKPAKGEGRHYMDYVAKIPCVLCQDNNVKNYNAVELHHEPLKKMGGGNSSDFDVVPLCKAHHDLMHGKLSIKRAYDVGLIDVRGSKEKVIEFYKIKCERWKSKILINYIRAREKE